jgi:signal transduction histidine kinase
MRGDAMTQTCQVANRRILVIDDNDAIHADFHKIIGGPAVDEHDICASASLLFGDSSPQPSSVDGFDLDSAHQGQEGLALVQKAMTEGVRYSMAFVDVRMPPGWDGIETVRRIWEVDSEILIVICTAYSDRSWEDMVTELGRSDRFLVLKKPFDNVEVRQLALALTERWRLAREAELELNEVEQRVSERTRQIESQSQQVERSEQEMARLNEQLEVARRQAHEAEQAKTDFLARLSQEIKPPTTAIQQFAQLLRDDGDLSRAPASRIRTIDAILDHAKRLVERLNPIQ